MEQHARPLLIEAIGQWALQTAAQQARAWEDRTLGEIRVSINLSSRQLEGSDFLGSVARVLEETGLDPRHLDLEITESVLMRNEEGITEALQGLRDSGISISLDDFGTGYSSLSYLRSLPIDTLKIDRSFIRRIDEEPQDALLVGAIISMAKVLGLRVAVEGIETEEQIALLREAGCDEVQGNLVSPPVAAEDVPRVLKEVEKKLSRKQKARARRTARARPATRRTAKPKKRS